MLNYALLLTRNPHGVSSRHIDLLRSAGLADEEIHRICLVSSYFNLVNRVAEGLGVDLEQPGKERS